MATNNTITRCSTCWFDQLLLGQSHSGSVFFQPVLGRYLFPASVLSHFAPQPRGAAAWDEMASIAEGKWLKKLFQLACWCFREISDDPVADTTTDRLPGRLEGIPDTSFDVGTQVPKRSFEAVCGRVIFFKCLYLSLCLSLSFSSLPLGSCLSLAIKILVTFPSIICFHKPFMGFFFGSNVWIFSMILLEFCVHPNV